MKSTHDQIINLFKSAGYNYPADAADTVEEHVEDALRSKVKLLVESGIKAMKTLIVFDKNLSGNHGESYEVENVQEDYEWGTVWYGKSIEYPEKVGFRSRVKLPDLLKVAAQGVIDAYKSDRDLKIVDPRDVLRVYRDPRVLKELTGLFESEWDDLLEEVDFDRFEGVIDGNIHDLIMEDSSSTFHPNDGGPERSYGFMIDTALKFQYDAQKPTSEFKGKYITIKLDYEVDLKDIYFDGERGFYQ